MSVAITLDAETSDQILVVLKTHIETTGALIQINLEMQNEAAQQGDKPRLRALVEQYRGLNAVLASALNLHNRLIRE